MSMISEEFIVSFKFCQTNITFYLATWSSFIDCSKSLFFLYRILNEAFEELLAFQVSLKQVSNHLKDLDILQGVPKR